MRTPVPPLGSEALTSLTGVLRDFFYFVSKPFESNLTLLESGHLARYPDPFEVGETTVAFTKNGHFTAEMRQPTLGTEDGAEDQGIDVLGVLKINEYALATAGHRSAQRLTEVLGGLRVCLALPRDYTHPLPHARSVEACVHIGFSIPSRGMLLNRLRYAHQTSLVQDFRKLHGIRGGALAQVVAHDPEVQAAIV